MAQDLYDPPTIQRLTKFSADHEQRSSELAGSGVWKIGNDLSRLQRRVELVASWNPQPKARVQHLRGVRYG